MAEYIEREANTLEMTHHTNIVKFLGREKIYQSERQVIIMEYCTQGNVKELIDLNPNGLHSAEFYRFGEQLVSAIEYLNRKCIIHRDIKPDNIMISKRGDGFSTYKIGDFGAARHLKRNQKYTSLYGTHEYLHPDLFAKYYYKALDITPKVDQFDYSHDFWSIGVTLFETGTGQLPFEPINGREDVKTMYRMIATKENGQISAIQNENGIEWSQTLPETSSIASDNQVTQFLAGLINVSFIYDIFQTFDVLILNILNRHQT